MNIFFPNCVILVILSAEFSTIFIFIATNGFRTTFFCKKLSKKTHFHSDVGYIKLFKCHIGKCLRQRQISLDVCCLKLGTPISCEPVRRLPAGLIVVLSKSCA